MESFDQTIAAGPARRDNRDMSLALRMQRYLARFPLSGFWRPWGPKAARVGPAPAQRGNPWFIAGFLLVIFLLGWHLFTLRPAFDAAGITEEQLQLMEFNGDIVRNTDGTYIWNPEKEKVTGVPGPLAVLEKARIELAEAFETACSTPCKAEATAGNVAKDLPIPNINNSTDLFSSVPPSCLELRRWRGE